jgi:hypothetical protein
MHSNTTTKCYRMRALMKRAKKKHFFVPSEQCTKYVGKLKKRNNSNRKILENGT